MLATAKVPNLKANHNSVFAPYFVGSAVLATTKVPNLKANYQDHSPIYQRGDALAFGREEQEAI